MVTVSLCRWILSHISAYSVRRRIYVLWLNSVMLVAGGLATIPCISWGHKVYWMVISCVPFPELCYHIWRMLSDAIESSEPLSDRFSLSGLYFVRVFGQFSYQLFPAIYFAAYDGCLPLYVSEPLWSICDWCLKMCMTSSLMEAEFFTVAQVCFKLMTDSHSSRIPHDALCGFSISYADLCRNHTESLSKPVMAALLVLLYMVQVVSMVTDE